MKYRFLENIATADLAFEAYGKTPEELFQNCALALTATMVDEKTVKPKIATKYQMTNIKIEELLFDFLSELILYKDRNRLLFSKFKLEIKELGEEGYLLEANFKGEKIDPFRHRLRADVKAVTWHEFKVEKKNGCWKARVILDI